VYHRVQFSVLWFAQCIPVLLVSLGSNMGLNITCMLDPDNELTFSSSLKNLEHYIADIRLCIPENLPRLNDNKIYIIYLALPHCVKSLWTASLQVGASSIIPNGPVQILGVIFDQCINMYEHVTSVCRAAYYHLKNIHYLKAFLTQEAPVTVVHAFVTYRIDYVTSCYMAYPIIKSIAFSELRIVQLAY